MIHRLKTSSLQLNNKCCFLHVWWDTSRWQMKSLPLRLTTLIEQNCIIRYLTCNFSAFAAYKLQLCWLISKLFDVLYMILHFQPTKEPEFIYKCQVNNCIKNIMSLQVKNFNRELLIAKIRSDYDIHFCKSPNPIGDYIMRTASRLTT